ncbi:hypothetical protein F5148DRAFT_23938 [Russula earlei]|uniref:Uncharacterized protein n=1 Tax=Russula earlei TaxID=71964 RepID=A0ACC0U947_9AGAM|nr:hypothetical protein F5148DRAFT_23938 [Russula earlei]
MRPFARAKPRHLKYRCRDQRYHDSETAISLPTMQININTAPHPTFASPSRRQRTILPVTNPAIAQTFPPLFLSRYHYPDRRDGGYVKIDKTKILTGNMTTAWLSCQRTFTTRSKIIHHPYHTLSGRLCTAIFLSFRSQHRALRFSRGPINGFKFWNCCSVTLRDGFRACVLAPGGSLTCMHRIAWVTKRSVRFPGLWRHIFLRILECWALRGTSASPSCCTRDRHG